MREWHIIFSCPLSNYFKGSFLAEHAKKKTEESISIPTPQFSRPNKARPTIIKGGNIYSVYLKKRIYIAERVHWYANEYGLWIVRFALSRPSIKYKMATMNGKFRTPFDVSRMRAFLAGNRFFSRRIPANDTPEVRFFYFSFDDGINQPFISRPICLMGLWICV